MFTDWRDEPSWPTWLGSGKGLVRVRDSGEVWEGERVRRMNEGGE